MNFSLESLMADYRDLVENVFTGQSSSVLDIVLFFGPGVILFVALFICYGVLVFLASLEPIRFIKGYRLPGKGAWGKLFPVISSSRALKKAIKFEIKTTKRLIKNNSKWDRKEKKAFNSALESISRVVSYRVKQELYDSTLKKDGALLDIVDGLERHVGEVFQNYRDMIGSHYLITSDSIQSASIANELAFIDAGVAQNYSGKYSPDSDKERKREGTQRYEPSISTLEEDDIIFVNPNEVEKEAS